MGNVTNNLQRRARFYARVITQLFISQQLAGFRLKTADRAARHLSLGLQLINPAELGKALKLSEPIALSANSENVLAQRQAGLVVYQFQLSQGFWESYTRQDLPASEAIGLAERRKPVNFTFEDDPHSLVAGTTGSGKTECIKSALVALMTVYKPDELKLVLCDPNHMLSDFENESHLALPIARSQEDMREALLFCQQELTQRKAENIKDAFILCLVLDEASETLTTEADIAIVKTLVKQGRAFRVNAIVGTQKPNQKDLPGIMDMLLNRFVGKVVNAQVSAMLTGHAGLQAHKLTGKGDFLHIASSDDACRFQVAMATEKDFQNLERTEIQPVVIEQDSVIELPTTELVPKGLGGRPKLEVQPDLIGWYLYHKPQQISIAMARELLGISRDNHNLHKSFALEVVKTIRQLRQGGTA